MCVCPVVEVLLMGVIEAGLGKVVLFCLVGWNVFNDVCVFVMKKERSCAGRNVHTKVTVCACERDGSCKRCR